MGFDLLGSTGCFPDSLKRGNKDTLNTSVVDNLPGRNCHLWFVPADAPDSVIF